MYDDTPWEMYLAYLLINKWLTFMPTGELDVIRQKCKELLFCPFGPATCIPSHHVDVNSDTKVLLNF
jgi:hypothetical protein